MNTKSIFVLFVLSVLMSRALAATEIENVLPSGLKAKDWFGHSVRLTWDDDTELHATSVFQWRTLIYRNTVNQFDSATHIGNASFDWYEDSDIENGTIYYYWIQWEERSSSKKSKVSNSVRFPEGTNPTSDPFTDPFGISTGGETSKIPVLSPSQWHDPEIDFGALPQKCPRWSDSLENCPYLLEFHGYDIYLSKNLVDSRAEIWDFSGLSAIDRFLLSDEEQIQIQRNDYFFNKDPDRALSKRLLVFLSAFETVFVPESPDFGQRSSKNMMDLVPLLRELRSTPNAESGYPERIGFYIGSAQTDEVAPTLATICVNGRCKTCENGNCSDGSVLGFAGSGEDVHFPSCGNHAVACYNTEQFAFGLYLAKTYHENLYVLTHEFGHVWHQLIVPGGYENRCIIQNYNAAMKANRFRNYGATTARSRFASEARIISRLIDPPPVRGSQQWLDFWNKRNGGNQNYATTNHYEYFAELTAIWFGNQWEYRGYPGDVGELWEHDPPSYEMIRQAYGESLLQDFPTDCR